MPIELSELKKSVLTLVESGPLAEAVDMVDIEPDSDDTGTEFLRVIISVKPTDKNIDDQLEVLLEDLESHIAQVDERYASVRFQDAA
jgi:hypothetical protein